MKRILLIQGGMGAERDVSLNTAKAFAKALEELAFDFDVLDAGPDLPKQIQDKQPGLVLNALHGKYGEDGTVQGICEYLKIPYSGSGVLASALSMDKIKSKQVLAHEGVLTPSFQILYTDSSDYSEASIQIPLPFVVKPAREGSSVGISICKEQSEVAAALGLAKAYDRQILIESYVVGVEVTVPILNGKALCPIEIVPNEKFYDYEHKYTAGKTNYILPPNKSESCIASLKTEAERIFRILNLRSYARIDFMLDADNKIFFIEANPLPGCTETSLLPKSAKQEGIEFKEIIRHLVESASLDYQGVR